MASHMEELSEVSIMIDVAVRISMFTAAATLTQEQIELAYAALFHAITEQADGNPYDPEYAKKKVAEYKKMTLDLKRALGE